MSSSTTATSSALHFASSTAASTARRKENTAKRAAATGAASSTMASTMAGTKRRASESVPVQPLAAKDANVVPAVTAGVGPRKPRMAMVVATSSDGAKMEDAGEIVAACVPDSPEHAIEHAEEEAVSEAPTSAGIVPAFNGSDLTRWFGPATRVLAEMPNPPKNATEQQKMLRKTMARVLFLEDYIRSGGCGDVSGAIAEHRRKMNEKQMEAVCKAVEVANSTSALVVKDKEIADLKAKLASLSDVSKEDVDALKAAHATELAKLKVAHAQELERVRAAADKSRTAAMEIAIANARKEAQNHADAAMAAAKASWAQTEDSLQREMGVATARIAELSATVAALRASMSTTEASLRAAVSERERDVAMAAKETDLYRQRWQACDAKRLALQEEVLTLKGAIRVFARVRPALPDESGAAAARGAAGAASDDVPLFQFPDARDDATAIELVEKPGLGVGGYGVGEAKRHGFAFHRVFPPLSTQEDLFGEVEGLVQSTIDGHRVCIFAYGQTGAGKTYTMLGGSTPESMGLIPRSVRYLFSRLSLMAESGWRYTVKAEMLEIYNEVSVECSLLLCAAGEHVVSSPNVQELRDLLGKPGAKDTKYDIRHDKDGNTTVANLTTVPVADADEVAALLAAAAANRSTGATASNSVSSRSHSVFMMRITMEHPATAQVRHGILNLIDLAGSERIAKSGVNCAEMGGSDKLLKETQNINTSLSCLSKVIMALHSKAKHVSYRDSKLTYLLQNSLNGSSKTLMICNLNPLHSNSQESLCTLRFAKSVAEVTTK